MYPNTRLSLSKNSFHKLQFFGVSNAVFGVGTNAKHCAFVLVPFFIVGCGRLSMLSVKRMASWENPLSTPRQKQRAEIPSKLWSTTRLAKHVTVLHRSVHHSTSAPAVHAGNKCPSQGAERVYLWRFSALIAAAAHVAVQASEDVCQVKDLPFLVCLHLLLLRPSRQTVLQFMCQEVHEAFTFPAFICFLFAPRQHGTWSGQAYHEGRIKRNEPPSSTYPVSKCASHGKAANIWKRRGLRLLRCAHLPCPWTMLQKTYPGYLQEERPRRLEKYRDRPAVRVEDGVRVQCSMLWRRVLWWRRSQLGNRDEVTGRASHFVREWQKMIKDFSVADLFFEFIKSVFFLFFLY